MQEDFFGDGLLKKSRKELTKRINSLTDRARSDGIPIIWVRQEFRDDLDDAYLIMKMNKTKTTIAGTDGCKILAELQTDPKDYEIVKKRYSAFFDTELDNLLSDIGVNELIVAGINTHACIRTSVIDAYQRDMKVVIPRDCVASYDAEHHDITLRYLGGAISKVLDYDDIFREQS